MVGGMAKTEQYKRVEKREQDAYDAKADLGSAAAPGWQQHRESGRRGDVTTSLYWTNKLCNAIIST